ncbi:MAG TPA: hypothetical protein ENK18_04680 [Deltaproteobacteria bacterium]|nr:hypothetical protein [Deltaproteobacteria bacterium]
MDGSIKIEDRHDGLVLELPEAPRLALPRELLLILLMWLGMAAVAVPEIPEASTRGALFAVVGIGIVGLRVAGRALGGGPSEWIEVLLHQGVTVRRGQRRQTVPAWEIGRIERRLDRIMVYGKDRILEVGQGLAPELLDRLQETIADVRGRASPPPSPPDELQELRMERSRPAR